MRDNAERLKPLFKGIWSLEDNTEEISKIKELAARHPERYVMKPQKEGGGNNFYGTDIQSMLQASDD